MSRWGRCWRAAALCRQSARRAGWSRRRRGCTPLTPHPSPLPPLKPPRAVFIDGAKTATFQSIGADYEGGWYTLAEGAPLSAPFDQPFTLIL